MKKNRYIFTVVLLFFVQLIFAQKTIIHKKKQLPSKAKTVFLKNEKPLSKPDSLDQETGLVNDYNLMYIKAHCTACHSTKIIQQHRFTRDEWKEKIRWMQKYHKLWDLGETEKNVLDYLAKNYSIRNEITKISSIRQQALKDFIWYKLENK